MRVVVALLGQSAAPRHWITAPYAWLRASSGIDDLAPTRCPEPDLARVHAAEAKCRPRPARPPSAPVILGNKLIPMRPDGIAPSRSKVLLPPRRFDVTRDGRGQRSQELGERSRSPPSCFIAAGLEARVLQAGLLRRRHQLLAQQLGRVERRGVDRRPSSDCALEFGPGRVVGVGHADVDGRPSRKGIPRRLGYALGDDRARTVTHVLNGTASDDALGPWRRAAIFESRCGRR